MALTDFSPEELATIQSGSGWVDSGDAPYIPAASMRALQVADVHGAREDAQRAAQAEARADAVEARYRMVGERPPTLADVLDRASRRMGITDRKDSGPVVRPEADTGCDDPDHTFSEESYMGRLKRKTSEAIAAKREAIHTKVRERAEARKAAEQKATGPKPWTWAG